MEGKDRSEIKELEVLRRILTRTKHQGDSVSYCGYGGDQDSLERILWKYAHRAMEPEEMEAFENHKETCWYCLKKLTKICQALEEVEDREGYSRDKVRALFADRERKQKQLSETRFGSRLRKLFEESVLFISPARAALATGMAALVVIFVAFFVFHGQGPTPIGELVASTSLQTLPGEVKAGSVSESLSTLLLPNGIETSTALLPDTSVPEGAYFLSLGVVLQSLETLVQFSPLKGSLRAQADVFSDYMETLLEAVQPEGSFPAAAELFRGRMMSDLYGPDRLRDFLAGLKKDMYGLAGTGKLKKQKAREALDLGLWLALLNRDLNLHVMGFNLEQELAALLCPEYVADLEVFGSRYFHRISFDEMRPAFAALTDAAEQLKSGRLSPEGTRAALKAVTDIVHFSFVWSLSA